MEQDENGPASSDEVVPLCLFRYSLSHACIPKPFSQFIPLVPLFPFSQERACPSRAAPGVCSLVKTQMELPAEGLLKSIVNLGMS